MVRISDNIKRSKLKTELEHRIVNGEFSYGDRFPGLNQLVREYKASYVTINKAVMLLADEGYLRCRPGVGYFVCYAKPDSVGRKEINLISSQGYRRLYRADFDFGQALFEKHGWKVNLLLGNDVYDFTEQINSPHAYSIITTFQTINWQRFSATFGHIVRRTVMLGKLSGNPEITSIVADEYESVRLCMEHFAAMGRRKVALVCVSPKTELESLRIAAWRKMAMDSGLSLEWIDDHLLSLDLENHPDFSRQMSACYNRWTAHELRDADGVIVPSGLKYFLSACQQNGISIPNDLAVIHIGRQSELERLPAGVYYLDNNYSGHFQYALDILEARFKFNRTSQGTWYFCPPLGIVPTLEKHRNKMITNKEGITK